MSVFVRYPDEPVIIDCLFCGTTFKLARKGWYKSKQQFCSERCRTKYVIKRSKEMRERHEKRRRRRR